MKRFLKLFVLLSISICTANALKAEEPFNQPKIQPGMRAITITYDKQDDLVKVDTPYPRVSLELIKDIEGRQVRTSLVKCRQLLSFGADTNTTNFIPEGKRASMIEVTVEEALKIQVAQQDGRIIVVDCEEDAR